MTISRDNLHYIICIPSNICLHPIVSMGKSSSPYYKFDGFTYFFQNQNDLLFKINKCGRGWLKYHIICKSLDLQINKQIKTGYTLSINPFKFYRGSEKKMWRRTRAITSKEK